MPSFPAGSGSVFAATLLNMLAVGAALPVLPRYVKGPIGGSDVEVGLVIGAFAFAAIIIRPLAGRWGDRRGRRPVMVIGTAFTAIAGALYAIPGGVAGLVIARVILGAGEGVVYTSGAAWMADRANDEERGRVIGLYGLAIWGGVSIGPVLGEVIFTATDSYNAVWGLCVALSLASLAAVYWMPNERSGKDHSEEKAYSTGWSSLVPKASIRPGLSLMTANLGYAAVSSFLVLMLDKRGIGHGAMAFSVFAAAVVVNRLVFGDLPDRLGGRKAAMYAAGLEGLGLLTLAAGQSLPVVLIGSAVMGSGFAMLFPSLALLVLAGTRPEQRGAAMGTFTAFFDIGLALGSPLVGVVAATTGYGGAFVAGALGALGGLLIAATTHPHGLDHGEPDAPEPI
jgi:MFS family permease